jgi:cytoskeletal protein RodZ
MAEIEFSHKKISSPKSLGEILKSARKRKGLTLAQAEEETRVRTKYLEALEEGRFDMLPGSIYTQGFLVKYAEFLGLEKEPLIRQLKTEQGEDKAFKLVPERKIKEHFFSITPRFMAIIAVIIVLAGIFGYIVYSVRNITQPPNLQISSPSSNQIIKEAAVTIIGKTDEGATLMINNQAVLLDDRGNFRQQVKLNPGLNTFEVVATNRLKKQTVKLVQILAEF